jgi:CheY-like chemotaxis protein
MGKRILLADDSLTIQKVVELTFSDSDYELVCVSNGQQALEKVRELRPDLILADVVMPEKNGYEVCEAIKGDPATARIPVVLLSGTFEPFDRERAERIGAEAIVSKPFDSQQLLSQVEALLDRVPPATTIETPVAPRAAEAVPAKETAFPPSAGERQEEAPFDVGFSAEDFTASIRAPARPEGMDPFEEEYGRTDVESAIQAFEKSQPQLGTRNAGSEPEPGEKSSSQAAEDVVREPLAQWLTEEPDRPVVREGSAVTANIGMTASEGLSGLPADLESPETIAMKLPDAPPPSSEQPGASSPEEISEEQARDLFDVPPPAPLFLTAPPPPPLTDRAAARSGTTAEVPREIEELAQTSSIPELTEMLSNVARPAAGGNDLTDEQIERLAARIVEKLSDRVVREIAWEVIPDMAEIVIKQRIKELEAGVE